MARRIAGELVQKSLERPESEVEDPEAARLSPEREQSGRLKFLRYRWHLGDNC